MILKKSLSNVLLFTPNRAISMIKFLYLGIKFVNVFCLFFIVDNIVLYNILKCFGIGLILVKNLVQLTIVSLLFFIMILLDAKFIDCFENHLFDNLDLKNMASYDYLRG